jgi:hypothetical protein
VINSSQFIHASFSKHVAGTVRRHTSLDSIHSKSIHDTEEYSRCTVEAVHAIHWYYYMHSTMFLSHDMQHFDSCGACSTDDEAASSNKN